MRPKDIKGWLCYGIPQLLSLDNAWAHHSHSLETLARDISQGGTFPSIELQWRPPYRARYGAIVERYFGNIGKKLEDYLRDAGGYRKDHFMSSQSARSQACLLYEDIEQFITDLIVDYQNRPHSELDGMTPQEKWLDGLQTGLPRVPVRTPDVERLFMRMDPRPRPLTKVGFHIHGLRYQSERFRELPRNDKANQPVLYHLRYDPDDISRISVFLDGKWVGDGYARSLKQPDGTYQRMSLVARKMQKLMEIRCKNTSLDASTRNSEIEDIKARRRMEQRQARREGAKVTSVDRTPTDIGTIESALKALDPERDDDDATELLAGFTADPH
jgi:hypothetical protein